MQFIPFELERWQSKWEHRVSFNLSESGVHPLSIAELLAITGTDPDELSQIRLGYSQADGTDELKAVIAALYPGASADNVIVTVGSSEANFVATWTLVEPGDHVAILSPLYRQTWGLAQNFGARVSTFDLRPELGWEPDPADIERAIVPGTKLVVVTNPNNPTGHVLSNTTRLAARRRGLCRGRARWRDDGDLLGKLRPDYSGPRPLEGLRSAWASHRMDGCAGRIQGITLVAPRLHGDRTERAERFPGDACLAGA